MYFGLLLKRLILCSQLISNQSHLPIKNLRINANKIIQISRWNLILWIIKITQFQLILHNKNILDFTHSFKLKIMHYLPIKGFKIRILVIRNTFQNIKKVVNCTFNMLTFRHRFINILKLPWSLFFFHFGAWLL